MKLHKWEVDGLHDNEGNNVIIHTSGTRSDSQERASASRKLKYLLRGREELSCFCKLINHGLVTV